MYNSVPTKFISVPTKSYFFLPGGAGAPPGPLGKYAYVSNNSQKVLEHQDTSLWSPGNKCLNRKLKIVTSHCH